MAGPWWPYLCRRPEQASEFGVGFDRRYYGNHRVDVNALQADGRWNAEVRARRILTQDKPER